MLTYLQEPFPLFSFTNSAGSLASPSHSVKSWEHLRQLLAIQVCPGNILRLCNFAFEGLTVDSDIHHILYMYVSTRWVSLRNKGQLFSLLGFSGNQFPKRLNRLVQDVASVPTEILGSNCISFIPNKTSERRARDLWPPTLPHWSSRGDAHWPPAPGRCPLSRALRCNGGPWG